MDRNKKIILILDMLLFVGLLVYSVIFLIINKSLNPATIAGNDIHIRLMWRQAAETIFTVCSFVYVIGHKYKPYFELEKENRRLKIERLEMLHTAEKFLFALIAALLVDLLNKMIF